MTEPSGDDVVNLDNLDQQLSELMDRLRDEEIVSRESVIESLHLALGSVMKLRREHTDFMGKIVKTVMQLTERVERLEER